MKAEGRIGSFHGLAQKVARVTAVHISLARIHMFIPKFKEDWKIQSCCLP